MVMVLLKTVLSFLLLVLPLASAKIRGAATEQDVEFRNLMGGMGSMGSDGCPDPDEIPSIQCSGAGDCVNNMACVGRDGCCCVDAPKHYCGVPSDCNRFLTCFAAPDDTTDTSGGTGAGPAGGPAGTGTGTGTDGGASATAPCQTCTDPSSGWLGFRMFRIVGGVCSEGCFDGLTLPMKNADGYRCGTCPADQV